MKRAPDYYEIGHRVKGLQEIQDLIKRSRLPLPHNEKQAEGLLKMLYNGSFESSTQLDEPRRIIAAAQRTYRQAIKLDEIAEQKATGNLQAGIWEAATFDGKTAAQFIYFNSRDSTYFRTSSSGRQTPEAMLEEMNSTLSERYGVRISIPARQNL